MRSYSTIQSTMTPEERYTIIVRTLTRNPIVTRPKNKKGFGSSALWTGGKMFAFLSSKGELVVKLPRERVDTLVVSGSRSAVIRVTVGR